MKTVIGGIHMKGIQDTVLVTNIVRVCTMIMSVLTYMERLALRIVLPCLRLISMTLILIKAPRKIMTPTVTDTIEDLL